MDLAALAASTHLFFEPGHVLHHRLTLVADRETSIGGAS